MLSAASKRRQQQQHQKTNRQQHPACAELPEDSPDATNGSSSRPGELAPSWDSLVALGRSLYQAGMFADAADDLSKAINLAPSNFRLYDLRAACLEKLGYLDDALKDANTMRKLAPEAAESYLRSGKILRLMGLPHNAADTYMEGSRRVPDWDPGWQLLALQLAKTLKELQVPETPGRDFVSYFPAEISLLVFWFVDFPTVWRSTRVSKTWRRTLELSPALWKVANFSCRPRTTLCKEAFTSKTLEILGRRAKGNLTALMTGRAPRIKDAGLYALVKRGAERLAHLGMVDNSLITSPGLLRSLHYWKATLRTLRLYNVAAVTDDSVRKLLTKCLVLRNLGLSLNTNLTWKAFDVGLAEPKAALEEIELDGCPNFSANHIARILRLFPGIVRISLLNTDIQHFHLVRELNQLCAEDASSADLATPRRASLTHLRLRPTAKAWDRPAAVLDEVHVGEFFRANNMLETFEFSSGAVVLDDFALGLGTFCSFSLKRVDLSGTGVSDVALLGRALQNAAGAGPGQGGAARFGGLSACPNLESVCLSRCPLITDMGVAGVALRCPRLHVLLLADCPTITDECLERSLGPHARELREVDLSKTRVSGAGVAALVRGAARENLRKLVLDHCSHLAEDAVRFARKMLGPGAVVQCAL